MFYYKIDLLNMLKSAGYNTNRLRKEKLLNESAIQAFRDGKIIGIVPLENICRLLECQPGDIIGYVPDGEAVPDQKTVEEIEMDKRREQAHRILDGMDDKKIKNFISLFA